MQVACNALRFLYMICIFILSILMDIPYFPFVIPLIVGVIVQTMKLVIDAVKYKRVTFRNIRIAGGFPSVHSGLSSSITTLIFLQEWPESLLFAITLVFTLLISYDAANVRYEAWRHAYYLNYIRTELKDVLWRKEENSLALKERIWHTPLEVVAGLIVGVWLTILVYELFVIWWILL